MQSAYEHATCLQVFPKNNLGQECTGHLYKAQEIHLYLFPRVWQKETNYPTDYFLDNWI